MKTKNRIFTILLVFMMVITYMPTLAFAEEPSDSEPLTNTTGEQLRGEEPIVLEDTIETEGTEDPPEETQIEENQETLPSDDNKGIEKSRTTSTVSIVDSKADITIGAYLDSGDPLSQESAVESGQTVKYNFNIDAHGSVINSIGIWMHPQIGLDHDGLQEGNNEYFFLSIADSYSYSSVDYSSAEGFFVGPDMSTFGTNPKTVSFDLEVRPENPDFWQVGVIEVYTADGDYMFANKWYYPSEVTEDYDAVTTPENCDELIYRLFDVKDDCDFDSLAFWYERNPNSSEITDRTRIAEDTVSPVIKGPFSVSTNSAEQRELVNYCFKVKENDRLLYTKVFFENAVTGEAAGSDIAEIMREESEQGYGAPIIDEDGFTSYNCHTKFYKAGDFRVAYIEAKDMHGNTSVFKNTESVIASNIQTDSSDNLENLTVTIAPYNNTGEVHISGMNGKLVQLNEGTLEIELTITDPQITGNIENYTISLWLRNATKGDYSVFGNDDPDASCVVYDSEKECFKFTTSGYGYNGTWYVSHLWIHDENYEFEKAYVDERYEEITRHGDFTDTNYEIMDFGAGSFNVGILDADSGVFATGAGLDEEAELSVENKGEDADFNAELLQSGYEWVASYTIEIDDQYLDDESATTLYIPVDTDTYPDGTVLTIRHKLKSGEIQTVNSTVTNGMVTIDVEECSPFLIEKGTLHEHIWNNGEITTPATCLTDGVKTFTCTVCGETKTEAIPAEGHHNVEAWTVTKEATCSETGTKTGECTACHETVTEEIPIDATAHAWGDWTVTTAATCSTAGEETRTCEHDATHTEKRSTDVDPEAHAWGDWTVTKAATCCEGGEETRFCGIDPSHFQKRGTDVDPEAHAWGDWTDCEDGENHQRVCAHDSTHKETAPHSWNAGEVTTPATCSVAGVKTFTCATCGATKTEAIPAEGQHNVETWTVTKAATCSETGTKTGECTVCHETVTEEIPIDPEAHVWGDWIVNDPEEGESAGSKTHVCTLCGQSETVGHTFDISGAAVTGIVNRNYTGGALTQVPTVDLDGVKLVSGTDYTVSYRNNVRIGVATVTITGAGRYGGTISKSFQVGPKATGIKKPKAAKKAFTAKWSKMKTKMVLGNGKKARITGYQIQYSTSSNFSSGTKTVTAKGYKKSSKKIKKLKAKTTYYVRVRTYINYAGKTYYSTWSSSRAVRTK